MQRPAAGRAHALGVVGKRVLRFGDAYRQRGKAPCGVAVELGARLGRERYAVRAVNLGGNRAQLLLQRRVESIDGLHVGHRMRIDERDDLFGKRLRTRATARERFDGRGTHAKRFAFGGNSRELGILVCREAIDGDHHRHAIAAQRVHMVAQVGEAGFEVALALRAQALHGDDENRGGGQNAVHAHHDVEIFFRAQIGCEAALVHHVIGQPNGHLLRDDAAGSMRDVGKGAGVHKGRRALGGLDEIGPQCVVEQRQHGAGCTQIGGSDGQAGACCANHDCIETPAQVFAAGGQAKNRHDLRRGGDDESAGAIGRIAARIHAHHNVAQRAVVHVQRARPGDGGRIDVERIAEVEMRIDERGQQIVRRSDGVEVAVEMEIDFLAGLHLRAPAACSAALHAEDRAQRRLARGDDGLAANARQALGKADGNHRLALARRGGRGGCDKNEPAARRKFGIAQQVKPDLGAVGAEILAVLLRDLQLPGDFANRKQCCFHMPSGTIHPARSGGTVTGNTSAMTLVTSPLGSQCRAS